MRCKRVKPKEIGRVLEKGIPFESEGEPLISQLFWLSKCLDVTFPVASFSLSSNMFLLLNLQALKNFSKKIAFFPLGPYIQYLLDIERDGVLP